MNIFKNQRGIAPIAIVLVILVLAAAGGGYYFVTKANKKSDLLQTQEQKDANEACMKVVNDEDQCIFFAANNADLGNHTIAMTSMSDGKTFTWTIANDGNGNSSMKMSGDSLESETIMFNGDTYTKAANSEAWIKYPKSEDATDVSETAASPFDDDEFNYDYNKDKLTSAGKEQCGDLTCFKYTYARSETTDEGAIDYDWTIWFDDNDYKIRKITGSGQDGENFEMVYTYGGVTISEPSPVQAAPDYENMTPAEIQAQLEQLYGQQN